MDYSVFRRKKPAPKKEAAPPPPPKPPAPEPTPRREENGLRRMGAVSDLYGRINNIDVARAERVRIHFRDYNNEPDASYYDVRTPFYRTPLYDYPDDHHHDHYGSYGHWPAVLPPPPPPRYMLPPPPPPSQRYYGHGYDHPYALPPPPAYHPSYFY